MQNAIFAPLALLPGGWARDVRVVLAEGRIAAVAADARPAPGDAVLAEAALVPALSNLHSHTFQRAMVGMTGLRGGGDDSFWTWRDAMYRVVEALTPEAVEAIAAQAFVEMLEAGFAAVAEFHYLHHGPGGVPYDEPGELALRVAAAAATAGIGLTLLPVLYTVAGAAGGPLEGGQRRFGHGLDGYLGLLEQLRGRLGGGVRLGAAPHSLRAVTPEAVAALAEAVPEGPLHIHAGEQLREVAEVEAVHGARPVALLLDRVGLGPRWCVVHATQMTAAETRGLARSGAVAGLCPITEADLGDGIFAGPEFVAAGGRFGVGSDSNVRISAAGELALLEYGQRLRDRGRNRLARRGERVGAALLAAALAGGAQALRRDTGAVAEGARADLLALDLRHPALAGLAPEELACGWIFAAGDAAVRDVWSSGVHVVAEGRHRDREAVAARFRVTMAGLRAAL